MFSHLITALLASAAPAPSADESVACIYGTVPTADVLAMIELGARGKAEPKPDELAAKARVQEGARACSVRHRWSEKKIEAAWIYAAGLASFRESQEKLTRYGIDASFLEGLVATFDEGQRAEILAGKAEVGPLIYEKLLQTGFRMKNDAEGEWEKLGEIVGAGVAGLFLRDKGLADFATAP